MTGAYLIIDPKYKGLVLATDARFHTTVEIRELDTLRETEEFQVVIISRQFNLKDTYKAIINQENLILKEQEPKPNIFLKKCV